MLALQDEPIVAAKQLLKQRRIRAAGLDHAVELLQLLEADRAAHLQRPDVVAGHDEPVGLEELVAARRTAASAGAQSRAQPWLRMARARLAISVRFVTSSPPSIVEMWWE